MKFLITGNLGYVGPTLVQHLRQSHENAFIAGFDTGYFAHCLSNTSALPERMLDRQYFGDVRRFKAEALTDIDAVVLLAAISNDPMGNKFEKVTDDINHHAVKDIVTKCRDRGVKHIVFASSCSMYGAAEGGPRQETDTVNPLTAYARSKNAVEESLKKMDLGSMTVTCLRFATACGMSARLRLDLVLNDFVAGAITAREISVLSDGSPWRPLIDVRDMCRAIDWAATRKQSNGGQLLHLNAGSDSWNFQVRDLARAVAEVIPGTKVRINPDAPPDKRSYRVSFARFKDLAPHHQPTVTLEDTIRGLRDGLESMGFDNKAFRSSSLMRLKVLEQHIESRALNSELYWTHSN